MPSVFFKIALQELPWNTWKENFNLIEYQIIRLRGKKNWIDGQKGKDSREVWYTDTCIVYTFWVNKIKLYYNLTKIYN